MSESSEQTFPHRGGRAVWEAPRETMGRQLSHGCSAQETSLAGLRRLERILRALTMIEFASAICTSLSTIGAF